MFSFWGVLSLIIRVLFEQQWSFFNYHFHHWNSYKTGCNVCANILIHRRALYWSSIEYCYHFIIICKAFKNVWNKTPNHTFSHLFKKKFAFEKKKKIYIKWQIPGLKQRLQTAYFRQAGIINIYIELLIFIHIL